VKTILLIDDNAELVELIAVHLEEQGYNVLTALNGAEGLEKLKEVEVDLIILDIKMPDMDGLEFYNRISTPHGRSKYPVLVLTVREDLREAFKDIDADGFMNKPFEIKDLLKEVKRIIKTRWVGGVVFLVDIKDREETEKIKGTLEKERFKVIVIEGIAMFREKAAACRPDFVAMEYMQDDMKGENFIRKVKGILPGGVPVIVYSCSGFDYEQKSLSSGADLYVGEPEDGEAIVTAIRQFQIEEKEMRRDRE